ncbi:UvrD-helicase domain-containing protein [Nocardia terpenica]|uniref:AAA family ATPase n=1 Tax=Nocardia terpenica TaxID=455432 RepID=A0A6G9YXA4_9NOCA|nr:UvrD-helicase domain-containing protein [Nocardia terpenica]QIS17767.1 AAA family ATPase [Nocardia terpenica]
MARAAGHDREYRRLAAERALAELGPMPGRQRNVLCALLSRRRDWRVLVRDRRRPPGDRVDVLLVGHGGVFGLVFADEAFGDAAVLQLRARLEQIFADVPVGGVRNVFVPETAELVLVAAPHNRIRADGRYLVVSEIDYENVLAGERRLSRNAVDRLARVVAQRDSQFVPVSVEGRDETEADVALLDVGDLVEQERARALRESLPSWMTFLDPAQRALVARNYNGPARIAGPAGTGKTVVALHRMAHRARRTTGKLLFTTFVRNLPPCQERAFARLAPFATDRARFMTLHAWAGELLSRRGRQATMDLTKADNAFNLAWSRVGSRGPLADIERDNRYWRAEIDRLIKGRGMGVDDFEEYAAVIRRGRHGVLRRPARLEVWKLFGEYEKIRGDVGFLDANDLIGAALQELRREPLDEPYDMVVVDEVQDMTVQGLRLVHAIAGDAPNALLLVGDGQQKIYAGGWRIADAGIRIVGRGELLKVNYRNCVQVMNLAASLEGRNVVDDLDGIPVVALSNAETVLPGGDAITWRGTDDEVEDAIHDQLQRIQEKGIPLSSTALITRTNHESARFRAALRRWEIPFQNLEDYYCGEADEVMKIGTVFRAKGLDFRAVLHPYFTRSEPPAPATDSERDRADLSASQRFVAVTRAREYAWLGIVEG